MNNELFLNEGDLPRNLTYEDEINLLKEIEKGNKKAMDTFIENKIYLALYRVNTRFFSVNYDKDELVSVGIMGLIKAVNSYKIDKNVKFNSFAKVCIDNEILKFLREIKNNNSLVSFEDNENFLEYDAFKEFERLETIRLVRTAVKSLPEIDRDILMLYFNGIYSQEQLGKKYNFSQTYISKKIRDNLEKLKSILVKRGIIEINEGNKLRKINILESKI